MNPPNPFHPKKCYSIVDSGAHSLTNLMFKKRKGFKGGKIDWSMYDTPEFWNYVDRYAAFIKEYKNCFDYYVNVDIIRNPKKSWKVLKYLENEHGLNPLPVVHFNTPMKWIEKHIEAGYKYIGMGGPVGKIPYEHWADRAWNVICSTKDRLPAVKVHGFAVTRVSLLVKYPWYSVDSLTWKKPSYQAQAVVALSLMDMTKSRMIFFDDQSKKYLKRGKHGKGRHILHYAQGEQKIIRAWLDSINVPWGKRNKKGVITEIGITNDIQVRCEATIKYFDKLKEQLPKWPWPFEKPNHRTPLLELFGD